MVDEVRTASRRHSSRDVGAARRSIQRREDDLGALVGRGADPSRADARNVLALQRTAGNRATAQLLKSAVQRDLSKTARPKGIFVGARPKSVKAIDKSLATLADKLKMPGALDQIKTAIGGVLKAVGDFRGTKAAKGKWAKSVTALEAEVKTKEAEIDQQIAAKAAKKQTGIDRLALANRMDPQLAKYAARTGLKAEQLEEDRAGPSIGGALNLPRGDNDELTDAGIKEMIAAQAGDLAREQGDRSLTFAGLSVDELRAFMKAHTNALTGKTMYPELRNVTDPNDQPDKVVTSLMDLGGVTMQVEHNPSDVNLDERLQLVKDAVKKMTAAGVKVPSLKIHLPKYGKNMAFKADAKSGKIECWETDKSSRAVFMAPDFLHLSSEVIGTPDVTKVKNPATGQDEYKFSSTGFDPSGAATIVHEFGHAIHSITAPAKFQGLWGTTFSGKTPSGKDTGDVAIQEVSQYGNKPREFVAEVFLGLVYGKIYSDDVMQMYKSFGGPLPTSVTVRAAAKAM